MQKKSFFQKCRKVIMCVMLAFMLGSAVAPAPAHAVPVSDIIKSITQWVTAQMERLEAAERNSHILEIINFILDFIVDIGEWFGELMGTIIGDGKVLSWAQKLTAKISMQHTNAIANARTANMRTGAFMRLAQKTAPPKHEYLCKAIMIHQLVTTTTEFEREVSRMTAESISNRNRCPTCNGTGADFYQHEDAIRRRWRNGSALDGYPASAQDTTTIGTDGRNKEDADISPIDGSLVYEIPAFIRRTYTDTVSGTSMSVVSPADPTTDEQRFFLSAWQHLFNVAGPRPTPPRGRAFSSEAGARSRAMFNHCTANQNALIKQCTDLLAFYTRPNSEDDETNAVRYREAQNSRCRDARGIVDIERFGNCERGLSPYEAGVLAQTLCKTNQHSLAMKMGGMLDPDLLKTSDLCSISWNEWSAFVARKHYNCSSAIEAMHSLKNCWASVDPQSKGYSSASNENWVPATKGMPSSAKGGTVETPFTRINALRLLKSMPQGKPVALDEVPLPQAVGQ